MTFEEIVDQALAMLQRRGRVAYRTLKRQFNLDDDALDDLKDELLYAHPHVVDDDGRGLVWTGEGRPIPTPVSPLGIDQEPAPRSYTPAHLTEKILQARSSLEGERKQVTVLFADLKGSMELLADRDPEEARTILDPVLERMMAAVHRYEGTVNQVMGDGIMALFGAPLAHEDHAVRACYAALRMQDAIGRYATELRQRQGLDVQIRVGLNSGEVVVRSIGNDLHMDYTAVGQTTHLAARLEQLARPGTTLLTGETLRLVEGYVEVDPLGPIPVKGLPEPIEAYELQRAGAMRSRLQASVARGLPRFVGREGELDQLRQALGRASGGHGQVVAIVGEPGVGKSRLVWEVTHSHRVDGWLVLQAGSVSYGKATSYLPVIDLLKRYCAIEDRDGPRAMREKLTGKLVTLDRAQEGSLPALLALLDVPTEDPQWPTLDPSQRRRRTLEAVKRLVLRESQMQPLLVVFEDLHWIDAETQALLDGLVESLPAARLLLLVNYRPEYQHPWGSRTYYTQLRLDPLPPETAEELLGALLGPDAGLDPLKRLLIARTEGNPFFLEESVQSLVETGFLLGERGAYRLERPLPAIQVPATVQAVLATRIDRLPPEEKRLLQTASVIGTEVPFHLLQAIAEVSEEVLHRGLTHLQAAEFLYETTLFPELAYTFKHALTHEVAYGSLLQERRRALHARIVEAIEQHYPERFTEQVERLAHHALRGEVWDKAVAYCRQAGGKATDRSAYQEAAAYLEQALEALHHLPEDRGTREQAIDIRLNLRVVLFPLGGLQRALDHLREAETVADHLHDQRRLGQVLASIIGCWYLMGAPARAVECGERVCAIAAALGDVGLQMRSSLSLGQTYVTMGHYRRAADYLSRTMHAPQGDLPSQRFGSSAMPAIVSRTWMAWSLAELGAFAEGRASGAEAIQMAEAIGHPYSLATASFGLGLLYLRRGDLDKAIAVLEHGVDVCNAWGFHVLAFHGVAAFLGTAYVVAGRVAEALPMLERVVEQTDAMGAIVNYVLGVIPLGEGYLRAGRVDDALRHAQHAVEVCRQHQQRGHLAWALRLLGEVAAQHDPSQLEHAADYYRQALALAEDLSMRPLQAHCHLSLGKLAVQTGRHDAARVALTAAIELYRAMEMTFWLPEAETALAKVRGH